MSTSLPPIGKPVIYQQTDAVESARPPSISPAETTQIALDNKLIDSDGSDVEDKESFAALPQEKKGQAPVN